MYDRIAGGLRELRHPDLIVYLDAEDKVLLERIARRNRPYETAITSTYLDEVHDAYETYLGSGAERNVFRFDTTSLNLASSKELNDLFGSILGQFSANGSPL